MVCRKGGCVAVLVGAAILASCRADVCGKKTSDTWEGACKGSDPHGEGTYTHASGVIFLPRQPPRFPPIPLHSLELLVVFERASFSLLLRVISHGGRGKICEGGGTACSRSRALHNRRFNFQFRGSRAGSRQGQGGRKPVAEMLCRLHPDFPHLSLIEFSTPVRCKYGEISIANVLHSEAL